MEDIQQRNCTYPVLVFLLMVQMAFNLFPVRAQNSLSDYRVIWATAGYKNKNYILLRSFEQNGLPGYLAVDPQSLDTKLVKAADLSHIIPSDFPQICLKMGNTPYVKALLRAQAQALTMQDAGITHAFPQEKGITLTIDLCPSHKALDRAIFISVVEAFKNIEKAVPVALSLTGKFLLDHEADIDWLKAMVVSGQINITWINHTYNHRYDPSLPINRNFLLEPGTDINSELLKLETAMITKGLLPSVFFRFPGLVSTQQLINKVGSLGLISIGSDAWLAKGQRAMPGSLVLIHGNGNEPAGVHDFIQLLHSEAAEVQKKQWLLYDLRTSTTE